MYCCALTGRAQDQKVGEYDYMMYGNQKDPFYDPQMDDNNAKWVQERFCMLRFVSMI